MSNAKFAISLILTFVIVTATVAGVIMAIDRYSCDKLEERSGINTEWYFVGGCYVEVNNRLIPEKNWRGEYENE